MLRPQWLLMLGLCLLVAAAFAWLGQWQLERAIDTDPPAVGATEEVRPLDEVVEPGAYLEEPFVGQQVTTTGTWVPEDFLVVTSRFNDGVEGYWVTGQLRIEGTLNPTSIAVAIGWAPTLERAEAAASELSENAATTAAGLTTPVTGRVISDEGPKLPPRGADPFEMTRMSPAALLGEWHDVDQLMVYRPYLALLEPGGTAEDAGLVPISSRPPDKASTVNLLNIFYAAEWAVFAGFAFYLWYRLARDAWEKELEDLEDARAEAS
ncbi:SURF1 family cytochrome oxidase biogenesis protein [Microbacterium sp. HM-570]